MEEQSGHITEHPMFKKAYGEGCGWGCNEGRIARNDMTFMSAKTEKGKLVFYFGEGKFTGDPIEEGFFGCAGVAQIQNLQGKLKVIGKQGFRHHVSVSTGHHVDTIKEAFETYLGYEIIKI
jgi:L-fucose isomerase-like protein